MRKVVTLLCISLSFAAFGQAKLKFADAKKNFGFVKKGEKVVLQYDFVNEGNQPLVISDAKAECSCTTAQWPKQPIAPGQKGVIEVTFDTAPTYDRQDRIVEVYSNASSSPHKVRFKGVVLVK
jgi:hypothetical protein